MRKKFNVTGVCNPKLHYMVNIDKNLQQMKDMIEEGDYFVINRARQYGKTTTLCMLDNFLCGEYLVVHLDFQMLGDEDFASETAFVTVFMRELLDNARDDIPEKILEKLELFAYGHKERKSLNEMFHCFKEWFRETAKSVILMIDEVDSASNHPVFIDFLAQLRAYYLARTSKGTPAFQSVILASVHDIRHLKKKVRGSQEISHNSPWNIAADFLVDMSFDCDGIAGMLMDYEKDHKTGMDVKKIAGLIYEYTSGYPYLVSRICKLIDEQVSLHLKPAWTKEGFLEAVKLLLLEKSSLFESLLNKLEDYPELGGMLYEILFQGKEISYTMASDALINAEMFGFLKKVNAKMVIANRIFEVFLYDYFLTDSEITKGEDYDISSQDKSQFIANGHLNMRLVLEKFIAQFTELYGEVPERFYEEEGRRLFLMFLRPIINGRGNYYIEAQTRTALRTDVIVDYGMEQFVIELKIWKGNAYHEKGERQLAEYLDYYHLDTGYLLTFNFNKKKQTGIREVRYGDKLIVEAVV